MKKRFLLQSNKGSSLIVVLMILITMSLLGLSIMAVTMSEINMSVFYDETNKAYYLAEDGIAKIAKAIDERVAGVQEIARSEASDYINDLYWDNPEAVRKEDGSILESISKNEYDDKYRAVFHSQLVLKFQNVNTIEEKKALLGTESVDGTSVYLEPGVNGEKVILESALFDGTSNMTVVVMGEYNGYKKKLKVVFDLLPNSLTEYYQIIPQLKVNKVPDKPSNLLKNALVSRKNIIVAGGTVDILGNVLSFGTIPSLDTSKPPLEQEEHPDAPWYRYGGIIAGIPDITTIDVNGDGSVSTDGMGNYEFGSYLGFDTIKTGFMKSGSIRIRRDLSKNIPGNAATMSYIHSLYGTSEGASNITVEGKTYARSVRLESGSNFSQMNFGGDVCTLDNLQIDSNSSTVNIDGVYYGISDYGYILEGLNGNSGEQALKDAFEHKRTSSVVVNGDSTLNFNNKLYIGGSTFFKNLEDSSGKPYMTGIAALKSSKNVVSAYKEGDYSNPTNKLFWYNSSGIVDELVPRFKSYGGLNLMTGRVTDVDEPPFFPISYRAVHFKSVWEKLWNDENNPDYDIFEGYVNTDHINVSGQGITNGKLNGYSNGAIVANGQVYSPYDFNERPTETEFHLGIQKPRIEEFHQMMEDFIGRMAEDGGRLSYVHPRVDINSIIDGSFTGANKIPINSCYISASSPGAGIVYYGDRDADITMIDGKWYIGGSLMPEMAGELKGILFVDGNIYIDNDFNFKGIIMASGNIIFKGNSNITYSEDTVRNLLNADVNIGGIFRLLTYEIPDNASVLLSQRISDSKNIRVVQWNEISHP